MKLYKKSTKHGLCTLTISTHGFSVSAMLDKGATQSFVSHKLAKKLLVIVQDMTPLTVTLPIEKVLVAT